MNDSEKFHRRALHPVFRISPTVWSPRPRRRPRTEMSSSKASQWRPRPPPLMTHVLSCSGEAACNRGKNANGTPRRRPSASCTHMAFSSKSTSSARGSMCEIFIPKPPDHLAFFFGEKHDQFLLRRAETPGFCKNNLRIQPNLRERIPSPNMYVKRFTRNSLVRKEEEPVSFVSENDGHEIRIARRKCSNQAASFRGLFMTIPRKFFRTAALVFLRGTAAVVGDVCGGLWMSRKRLSRNPRFRAIGIMVLFASLFFGPGITPRSSFFSGVCSVPFRRVS